MGVLPQPHDQGLGAARLGRAAAVHRRRVAFVDDAPFRLGIEGGPGVCCLCVQVRADESLFFEDFKSLKNSSVWARRRRRPRLILTTPPRRCARSACTAPRARADRLAPWRRRQLLRRRFAPHGAAQGGVRPASLFELWSVTSRANVAFDTVLGPLAHRALARRRPRRGRRRDRLGRRHGFPTRRASATPRRVRAPARGARRTRATPRADPRKRRRERAGVALRRFLEKALSAASCAVLLSPSPPTDLTTKSAVHA